MIYDRGFELSWACSVIWENKGVRAHVRLGHRRTMQCFLGHKNRLTVTHGEKLLHIQVRLDPIEKFHFFLNKISL